MPRSLPPSQASRQWPNTLATSARPSRVREPAARSIHDPASRLRQRQTRPSSPPGSFVVYLRKYLSGRAPALTFPDPARLRTKPDADVLTGGLSYDHKFSVSGKPKDELVRTPRARVHPPRPSISANPRVMPTRQPPARAPPSGIRDHPTPRPLLPLHRRRPSRPRPCPRVPTSPATAPPPTSSTRTSPPSSKSPTRASPRLA